MDIASIGLLVTRASVVPDFYSTYHVSLFFKPALGGTSANSDPWIVWLHINISREIQKTWAAWLFLSLRYRVG